MPLKTIYCAQAFWSREGRLRGGEVYQFSTEARAREGAAALLTGAQGVAVFSLEGYPDIDLWEEPHLIWTEGLAPSVERDAA